MRGFPRQFVFSILPVGFLLVAFDGVRTDNATTQRLTRDGHQKQHPAWSPDGKLLAFTIYRKGKVGVVETAPGSAEWKHITTFDDNPEYEPSWSLDGKRIVFVHVALQGTDGQLEIHSMNPDGSDSKRVVAPAKRPAQDEHPAWSPDGKTIAFTTTRDANQEIYRVFSIKRDIWP